MNLISFFAIECAMKNKHARTIEAIFRTPTLGGIVFADIEALRAWFIELGVEP
jgi:hypothetical protein